MYNNIKNRLCVACKNLAESNVIPNGAFISIKDSKGQCYALNNNKIPLSEASESNIIIVGFDGNVIEGDVSGIDPYFVVHKVIYNENEEITTIINPRSRYNSIWASLGRSLVPNSFFYCENLVGETLATGSVTLEPGEELYESINKSAFFMLNRAAYSMPPCCDSIRRLTCKLTDYIEIIIGNFLIVNAKESSLCNFRTSSSTFYA